MEYYLFHTYYPNQDEDEYIWRIRKNLDEGVNEQRISGKPDYIKRNNEVVKCLPQKCVIGFGRDSEHASEKCGHLFTCSSFFDNKDDVNILKCVVCRTWLILFCC